MFDADLVRYLCGKLAVEQEPQRFNELLSTLHSVVRSDTEDARLRLAYLLRHYPEVFDAVPDEQPTSEAA
jgi:hypothetical protein